MAFCASGATLTGSSEHEGEKAAGSLSSSFCTPLDLIRLGELLGHAVESIQFKASTASTNDDAIEWNRSATAPVLFACDRQTTGRGRHGRKWEAAGLESLIFTLLFPTAGSAMNGASLVAGIATAEALGKAGVPALLKWPNDLVDGRRRKLGGILVESRGANQSLAIGIGINLLASAQLRSRIGTSPAAGIAEIAGSHLPDRTELLAAIADNLVQMLDSLRSCGFAKLVGRWQDYTIHHPGEEIVVSREGGKRQPATYFGISDCGELICMIDGAMQRIASTEIHEHAAGY